MLEPHQADQAAVGGLAEGADREVGVAEDLGEFRHELEGDRWSAVWPASCSSAM
jgi:hypothetical protein